MFTDEEASYEDEVFDTTQDDTEDGEEAIAAESVQECMQEEADEKSGNVQPTSDLCNVGSREVEQSQASGLSLVDSNVIPSDPTKQPDSPQPQQSVEQLESSTPRSETGLHAASTDREAADVTETCPQLHEQAGDTNAETASHAKEQDEHEKEEVEIEKKEQESTNASALETSDTRETPGEKGSPSAQIDTVQATEEDEHHVVEQQQSIASIHNSSAGEKSYIAAKLASLRTQLSRGGWKGEGEEHVSGAQNNNGLQVPAFHHPAAQLYASSKLQMLSTPHMRTPSGCSLDRKPENQLGASPKSNQCSPIPNVLAERIRNSATIRLAQLEQQAEGTAHAHADREAVRQTMAHASYAMHKCALIRQKTGQSAFERPPRLYHQRVTTITSPPQ